MKWPCRHPLKQVAAGRCQACGHVFPEHQWAPIPEMPHRKYCAVCCIGQRLDGNEIPCGYYDREKPNG